MKKALLPYVHIILWLYIAAIVLTTAGMYGCYRQPWTIGTVQETSPTPPPDLDDMKYWTEPIVSPDGLCHCPGGFMCTACGDGTQCVCDQGKCACKPNRLDYLEARRRYESVRHAFAPAVEALNRTFDQ